MPQKYHSDFIPDTDTSQQFTTKLSSDEEKKFQDWVKTNKIPGADEPNFGNYDMRGFWKENPNFQHKEGEHFPDTYKQPGHETFSVESKYAKGRTDAGRWEGDKFIPPSKKSNSKYHSDFIPDNVDEQTDKTDNEPSTFSRLSSGVSSFLSEHPRIKEIGERLLTGTSPEYEQMLKEHNIPQVIGTPESEGSILPSWKSQPETFAGGFAKSIYEDYIRPQGTSSGVLGWSSPVQAVRFKPPGIKIGEVVAEDIPREGQKLLTAGPKFQATTEEIANTAAGESFPIRRSREIPYRPYTETPSGRIEQSYSTAAGDTPKAQEAWKNFIDKTSASPRDAIDRVDRMLPEGIRQPKSEDLLINEEGRLPGEMSNYEALNVKNEFVPWRGLRDLSQRILGRDILERDVEAGKDPFRGPIDWGPIASGNTDETALTASRPMGEKKPTARYRAWQQTGLEDIPDFPLYDVEGGPSHGTTTDVEGLKKLGIDVPETPENPHHPDFIPDEEVALNRTRPEKSDYVNKVLGTIKDGDPGLSHEIEKSNIPVLGDVDNIIYRGSDGKPVAVAKIIKDSNGKLMVMDFAADKNKGLLTGRAVKSIGMKLRELGATTPAGSVTPDAFNLIKKASKYDEPQFSRVLNFPNKGNVPERLQAAKFITEIADDRYNNALAKYNSGRMTKPELDVIKSERDTALAEHSRLVEQSKGLQARQIQPESEAPSFSRIESRGKIWENDNIKELSEKDYDDLMHRKEKEIMEEDDPQKISENFITLDNELKRMDRFPKAENADQEEYLGSLRDIALDKYRQTTNRLLDEGPQFAKQGEGKIQIGADVKSLGKVLGTSLYKGDIAPIATKELLQNSVDAIRHLGDKGEINVVLHPVQNYLEVSDNGKGMTRHELESVFTDLGASGKRSDEEAVGGFGLAKAAPLLGGEKSETVSVARDPKTGKLIEHSFSGTPDELLEGVDIHTKEVPEGTPTGTRVKVYVKPGSDFYTAKRFVENLTKSSRDIKGKINVAELYGDRPPEEWDFKESPKGEGKTLTTIKGKSADTTISIPSTSENRTRSYTNLHLSNNGMYQKTKEFYFEHEVPNAPSDIIIDVKSKVPEGHSDYPFTANREELRGSVEEQVKKYINENIVVPSVSKRVNELQKLYDTMPEISVGGGKFPNTFGRKIAVHDPGNRFTPEEFKQITNSPIFHNIANNVATTIDGIMSSIKSKMAPDWIDRLEKVGITFDQGLHGVHIPNPKTGKSMILINPFQSMLTSTPDEAAGNIVHTMLHEVAHVNPNIRGHNESFTINLGQIYDAFGARKEVDALDKILTSIETSSGEYHPELQEILQRYKESRGREATTEDLLTGTGIKSKAGKGPEGSVPPSGKPNGEGTTESAVNKLFTALTDAKSSAAEQAQKLKVERARRFAAFEGVKVEGVEGAKKSMGKLRGEYEKSELPDNLKLSKEETNQLFTAVKRANITTGEKARGYTALFKLMEGGEPPVRSELAVLDSVFGNGFAGKIMELHGGLGGASIKIGKAANTMKAMMGSIDVSAPMRQGIGLIHKPEWRDAFVEMFKYFGNKEYYEAAMQHLENRPTYLLGREAGLFLNKPGSLLSSEELFLNSYIPELSKIPVFGRVIKHGVGASERAYSGFLNKLRADVFDSLIKEARVAGHEAFTVAEQETEDGIKKVIVPSKTTENISKFINNATGRGSLGKLEKIAPELNTIIWSPRLISSRLTVLNPTYYYKMDKFTRWEAIKSLFAIAATGATISSLAAVIGGKSLGNPFSGQMNWFGGRRPQVLSSDFGKVRMPSNQVLDPWGGFQQPIVAAARFMAGRTEAGQQTRSTTTENFAVSKLSPIASLAYELAAAKKWTGGGGFQTRFGQPSSVQMEVGKRFVPIFMQDFNDLVKSDASFAEKVGMSGAAAVGMGVQDYPERTGNKPRRMTLRP